MWVSSMMGREDEAVRMEVEELGGTIDDEDP